MLEPGSRVYTVNAKTNTVDQWRIVGTISASDGLRYVLEGKLGNTILPTKCVYKSKLEAQTIADTQ